MITVEAVAWGSADSVRLRGLQRVEIAQRYGTPDSEPGAAPSEADIEVFLVAYADGRAVGCGGLRRLSDDCAEIKRMYVEEASRGSGVSVAILRALEREARERRITVLRLETGDRQPDAIRFYEREGYVRIPNFGPYIGSGISLCYERDLD